LHRVGIGLDYAEKMPMQYALAFLTEVIELKNSLRSGSTILLEAPAIFPDD
jgi:hypothetical protein